MNPKPPSPLRALLAALVLAVALNTLAAEPVRGVWVAGPQHNQFWSSRESIRAELQTFQRAGLNTVYVVMLMSGRTLYPSDHMARITGACQLESLGQRDALQEVLDEAQPLRLRVVAWLEFGFASHYGSDTAPRGLLKHRPDWVSLTRNGQPVVKNGFHWMNAFDPELQQLMIDLSTELLTRYPRLHGVQGDDRLPALPSSGGYDLQVLYDYGWQPSQPLPLERDLRWLQFRAERLTAFLKRWHAAVKAVRQSAVLSLAPSPYPWASEEYLQDWPAWMRAGLVDELLPQLYRRDLAEFEKLLAQTRANVPPDQLDRVFPGMLLSLGPDVIPSADLLKQWIASTRAAGFKGEVQFHSAGVGPRAEVLREAYLTQPRMNMGASCAAAAAPLSEELKQRSKPTRCVRSPQVPRLDRLAWWWYRRDRQVDRTSAEDQGGSAGHGPQSAPGETTSRGRHDQDADEREPHDAGKFGD